MRGQRCQLLKFLLCAPPQPPLALLNMGFHWLPSGLHPWSPDFHAIEDPRMDSDLGKSKAAAGWKDAQGWGGKEFLRFPLTWKLGCWIGAVPEESQSWGRITFIQLLSVFPRQNSHQRCQMHSDFPPCTLGIAIKRRDRAPCPYARRDPRKSKKLEISFRCLNCKFLCLKRDFYNMLEIFFAYSFWYFCSALRNL